MHFIYVKLYFYTLFNFFILYMLYLYLFSALRALLRPGPVRDQVLFRIVPLKKMTTSKSYSYLSAFRAEIFCALNDGYSPVTNPTVTDNKNIAATKENGTTNKLTLPPP